MSSNLGRRSGDKGGHSPANPLRLVSSASARRGLSREVVEEISWQGNEPDWMRRKRIQAYEVFERLPMPAWGPDLSEIDFHGITYAEPRSARPSNVGWDSARLRLKRELEAKGVVFVDMQSALLLYPDLVQEHFMKRNVPVYDSRFAALNGAVWRGGWFVYVPQGARVDLPLRPPVDGSVDFPHTLIIAEPDSAIQFVEGNLAPSDGGQRLVASVVEVFVKDRARVSYVSVENASRNAQRFDIRRALVTGEKGHIKWIDASLGNSVTMVYPGSHLIGRASEAEHLSLWMARGSQRKDTGARVIHVGEETSSKVVAKNIAAEGGRCGFRAIVRVSPSAVGASAKVHCDSLVLDEHSRAEAWPDVQVHQSDVAVEQEGSIEGLSEERLRELVADGLSEDEARARILGGFASPVVQDLPTDLAVAIDRLIRT